MCALEGFVKREPVGDVEVMSLRGVCCVVSDGGGTRRRQIQRWSSVCSSRSACWCRMSGDPRPSCRRVCGDASRAATHLRGCSASLPPRCDPAPVVHLTLLAVLPHGADRPDEADQFAGHGDHRSRSAQACAQLAVTKWRRCWARQESATKGSGRSARRRRMSGLTCGVRRAWCADSMSTWRSRRLPALVMWPRRCDPPLEC